MTKLRVLSLFAGIGGFDLGLERTGGFETTAFCEINPFCRRVLAKHWPDVPCYEDVRTLTADALRRDGIAVDVICGGFPCQDISFAGKRAGLEGERSGLWSEYRRLIGELRPRFVIVENVPGLLSLGMGTVLGDLSALRYDAIWDCIPALAVGAPHRRDRIWLVAYSHGQSEYDGAVHAEVGRASQSMADTNNLGAHGAWPRSQWRDEPPHGGTTVPNARCKPAQVSAPRRKPAIEVSAGHNWWRTEPDVGRVADGVSARVDRLKSLGNAVVPQIPEIIGRAILEAIQ
jgi:DNA (cytosine-5)-methyltransferase 1